MVSDRSQQVHALLVTVPQPGHSWSAMAFRSCQVPVYRRPQFAQSISERAVILWACNRCASWGWGDMM
jgi:hypothetical protein